MFLKALNLHKHHKEANWCPNLFSFAFRIKASNGVCDEAFSTNFF